MQRLKVNFFNSGARLRRNLKRLKEKLRQLGRLLVYSEDGGMGQYRLTTRFAPTDVLRRLKGMRLRGSATVHDEDSEQP